jgi:hypothetical protein
VDFVVEENVNREAEELAFAESVAAAGFRDFLAERKQRRLRFEQLGQAVAQLARVAIVRGTDRSQLRHIRTDLCDQLRDGLADRFRHEHFADSGEVAGGGFRHFSLFLKVRRRPRGGAAQAAGGFRRSCGETVEQLALLPHGGARAAQWKRLRRNGGVRVR